MSIILKIVRGGKTYSVDLTPFIYGTKSENAWEESKHPRDKDGKFGKGGAMRPKTETPKPKKPKDSPASKAEENFKKAVDIIWKKALLFPNDRMKIRFAAVSDRLEREARKNGYDIRGYIHDLDVSGIRHSIKKHGDDKKERKRGQIAITAEDLKKAPSIVSDYDEVDFSQRDAIGNTLITYRKTMADGTVFYVEEIRTKRRTLTIKTIYKIKG